MIRVHVSGYPGKILMMLIIMALCMLLLAISEAGDEWSGSCLRECSDAGGGANCDTGSIRFIADQYLRAAQGEPYWDRAGEKKFTSAAECAEFRFSQLRAICPANAEALRRSIRQQ